MTPEQPIDPPDYLDYSEEEIEALRHDDEVLQEEAEERAYDEFVDRQNSW